MKHSPEGTTDNISVRANERPFGDSSIKVGVIGMGHVGPSIANALRANGHEIVGVNAHSAQAADTASSLLPEVPQLSEEAVVQAADLVVLAVPDSQIGPLVSQLADAWKPGQLVFHLSGVLGLEVLVPAAKKGALTMVLHPAMTFSGFSLDVANLDGCPIAVTASPLILPLAQAIVADLGGVAYSLQEADKPLYHAAMSHAANHLVTLVAQAKEMLVEAGVENPGEYLRPLTMAALDGALREGMGALTGPVSRGDTSTVEAHLEILGQAEDRRVILDTYRQLSTATVFELNKYQQHNKDNDDSGN